MVDLTTISEAQVQSLVLKKKERKVGGGELVAFAYQDPQCRNS